MGKATGCSPCGGCGKCGTGIARAGAAGHYSFGRMSGAANYSGGVDLFKAWREMRRDGAKYETGIRRKPYDSIGPLEKEALVMAAASVDYGGKHRTLYPGNIAGGAGKGYGMPVKGDSYQTNVINLAANREGMLDDAYRKTSGAGYQPNFEYSQAA